MNRKTIPGIHNYCDRWCERCLFTSQCGIYENFMITAKLRSQPLTNSTRKPLANGVDMLEDHPAMRDISKPGLAIIASVVYRELHEPTGSEFDQLCSISLQYQLIVTRWFEEWQIESYIQHLQEEATKQFLGHSENENVVLVKDCVDVVIRYSSLIPAKLMRAVSSLAKSDEWTQKSGLQKDSRGSAKIALIAIERSLQAWGILYDCLPEHEDRILRFLTTLQQLQRLTLALFPDAMNFKRPGFDDPEPA